jgi:hypothetical protein
MAKVAICFSLDSERDRDLVRWLDGLPKRGRSEAIRDALRGQLSESGVTLGDIYEAVMDLKRSGLVVAARGGIAATGDEPPDVAAALDNLGL